MNNKNIKKERGDFGEAAVCDYLVNRGYIIVKRNYRKRVGEIDIIAVHIKSEEMSCVCDDLISPGCFGYLPQTDEKHGLFEEEKSRAALPRDARLFCRSNDGYPIRRASPAPLALRRETRRKRRGIDPASLNKNVIAFIEVKTRKFGSLTDGLDSITHEKRRKIVKTARLFLSENPQFINLDARFDAAQVVVTTDAFPQLLEIEYYEDAFNPALIG